MSQADPLLRLLQEADSASAPPVPDDLVAKVHRRRFARKSKERRLGLAAMGVGAVIALIVGVVSSELPHKLDQQVANRPQAEPESNASVDVESLLQDAKAIQVEADALEKLIAAHDRQERLAELTAEHDRLIVATSAPDPEEIALERTASRAICQADFLLETLNDRLAATQAYRHITEQFPDTRWAMIAQDNLTRLEMN